MSIQSVRFFLLKGLKTGIRIAFSILQDLESLLLHQVDLFQRNDTLLLQRTRIELSDSWMSTNDFIHLWLSKGWFITFIMTPATVANQVNEYILMKLVSVGMRYTYGHQS